MGRKDHHGQKNSTLDFLDTSFPHGVGEEEEDRKGHKDHGTYRDEEAEAEGDLWVGLRVVGVVARGGQDEIGEGESQARGDFLDEGEEGEEEALSPHPGVELVQVHGVGNH